MLLGIYKSYEELEENLSIEDLNRMIAALHKKINDEHRFMAALKGVKLTSPEEQQDHDAREAVRRRAAARVKGIPLEEYNDKIDLQQVGIRMEVD